MEEAFNEWWRSYRLDYGGVLWSMMFQSNKSVLQALRILQGGQWVDIIDHWSIIDHFVKMIDVLEFEVNITLKWLIFHQNIPEAVMLFV